MKKRVIYQVYVGKRSRLYDHCVESVKDYCKAHNIEHVVQKQPILKIKPDVFSTNRSKESYEKHGGFLPIFEKENAFTYLKTNDQVAIIDADIWVRPGDQTSLTKFQRNMTLAEYLKERCQQLRRIPARLRITHVCNMA